MKAKWTVMILAGLALLGSPWISGQASTTGSSTTGSSGQSAKKPASAQSATLTPHEKEAQKHYRIALEAIKKNDFTTASDELKAAADLAPQNALIWYNLAVVESKKGDSKPALDHLHKATSLGLPKSLQNDAESLEAKLSYEVRQTGGSSSSDISAQAPQKSAASYDDTVHYIQERLAVGLQETSRCHFTYHVTGVDYSFNVVDLSPHVSWAESPGYGSINCSGGAKCVHWINRNGAVDEDEAWIFNLQGDTEKSKMEKALFHLLDLCGVRPAKSDLF